MPRDTQAYLWPAGISRRKYLTKGNEIPSSPTPIEAQPWEATRLKFKDLYKEAYARSRDNNTRKTIWIWKRKANNASNK
jgi:hypothetical protein